MTDRSPNDSTGILIPRACKTIGTLVQVLLPSIKMKSHSPRGVSFEKEFHDFLLCHFGGYTVTAGSITGYWLKADRSEECNEHREYQIAISNSEHLARLHEYLATLARQLKERTIFGTLNGTAFLINAARSKAKPHNALKRIHPK